MHHCMSDDLAEQSTLWRANGLPLVAQQTYLFAPSDVDTSKLTIPWWLAG